MCLCHFRQKWHTVLSKQASRNYSNISLPVSINIEDLPSTSSSVSLISAKDGIYSFSDCTFSPDNFADLSLQTHSIDSSDNRESYQFSLTQSEWLLICPSNKVTSLQSEWTNVFNTHLSTFFPFSVLIFLYHRININSLLKEMPLFCRRGKMQI